MKKLSVLLVLPFILSVALIFTGCSVFPPRHPEDPGFPLPPQEENSGDFQRLDTPTGLRFDGNNILTWNDVEGATSWMLSVDGELLTNLVVEELYTDLTYAIREGQTHVIGLQAVRYFGNPDIATIFSQWAYITIP